MPIEQNPLACWARRHPELLQELYARADVSIAQCPTCHSRTSGVGRQTMARYVRGKRTPNFRAQRTIERVTKEITNGADVVKVEAWSNFRANGPWAGSPISRALRGD